MSDLWEKAMKALEGLPVTDRVVVEGYLSGLSAKARGFRRMSRKMAGLASVIPQPLAKDVVDRVLLEAMRAGGDVECRECGLPYREHPELPGRPTFHWICSGRVVKL